MKKWVPAIALSGVAGALLVFFLQSRPSSNAPSAPAGPRGAQAPAVVEPKKPSAPNQGAGASNAIASGSALAKNSPAALPAQAGAVGDRGGAVKYPLEFTNFPPATVLENMRITFHQYASMFGGNPVGTNPEITAALNGNNPKQANFINAEAGMRIDSKGELVDPWGTPYFFHQLSGTVMEIHSAGPDRMMWTADDLVIK